MTDHDDAAGAMHAPARRLTLLSRAYCHLCDDMRAALLLLVAPHAIELVEIDIDVHPRLEARFGEWVPVLLEGDAETGRELCHYVLDRERVRNAVAAPR